MVMKDKKKYIDLVSQARKKLEELKESADVTSAPVASFDKESLAEKIEKDSLFLESIYDELIGNKELKDKYESLIVETMMIVKEIYEEAGVKPKIITPAVEYSMEPLSEDEVLNYYKRAFNLILEQEFNSKLRKHELIYESLEDNDDNCEVKRVVAPGIKTLMVKCINDGVLDSNDPEAVAKYALAEKAVVDAFRNVFIPEKTLKIIITKKNDLPEDYVDIFGNKMDSNLQLFDQQIQRIGSLFAPFIFMNALRKAGYNVPFNPAQVAGVTASCPVE